MKATLRTLLTIISLSAILAAEAQVTIIPKLGVNFAGMTVKSSSAPVDIKTYTGVHVGATFEINPVSTFFIQPGLFFSIKGYKGTAGGSEYTVNPNYVEVPVNVAFKFDIGEIKVFPFAGPYMAFGIAGKITGGGISQKIEYGSSASDNMRAFDFGLNAGAGIELQRIVFSAQYGLGLVNLSPKSSTGYEFKNKVISLSVGYRFLSR